MVAAKPLFVNLPTGAVLAPGESWMRGIVSRDRRVGEHGISFFVQRGCRRHLLGRAEIPHAFAHRSCEGNPRGAMRDRGKPPSLFRGSRMKSAWNMAADAHTRIHGQLLLARCPCYGNLLLLVADERQSARLR